jgi:hypothetical protein
VIEQAGDLERLAGERLGIADHARHQPRHRLQHHEGRDLAARQT